MIVAMEQEGQELPFVDHFDLFPLFKFYLDYEDDAGVSEAFGWLGQRGRGKRLQLCQSYMSPLQQLVSAVDVGIQVASGRCQASFEGFPLDQDVAALNRTSRYQSRECQARGGVSERV